MSLNLFTFASTQRGDVDAGDTVVSIDADRDADVSLKHALVHGHFQFELVDLAVLDVGTLSSFDLLSINSPYSSKTKQF